MSPVTAAARRRQAPILRVQRFIALRVVAAYRSVSLEAALLLARIAPIYRLAGFYSRTYTRIKELKGSGNWAPQADNEVRAMEKLLLHRQWKIHLENGANLSGLRVRTAVFPSFSEWIAHDRKWGVEFHLTQIMTGHECFGDYLCRIGKEPSNLCLHCGSDVDTAQHTLESCVSWVVERTELCEVIGYDLSLPSLVRVMLTSVDK